MMETFNTVIYEPTLGVTINIVMIDAGDLFDECVRQNPDDSYTVWLNSRCSCEQLRESYDHALNHIRYNDWEKYDVQEIESEAHSRGA